MSNHTPWRIAFRRPWPGTLRGFVLWVASLAFISLGVINYLVAPLPARVEQALTFALAIAPEHTWGIVFVVLGLGSGYVSYCHHGRDRYGYVTLATWCVVWGMGYVTGFLLYGADLRSLSAGLFWSAYGGMLTAVSAFPNVPLSDDEADR